MNVSRGYVILSGVAPTMAAKLAAAQDARDTTGAWRVINRIRVQASGEASDQELARRVEEAIRRNPFLGRL